MIKLWIKLFSDIVSIEYTYYIIYDIGMLVTWLTALLYVKKLVSKNFQSMFYYNLVGLLLIVNVWKNPLGI